MNREVARRKFLGFLAGSPLLATPALSSTIAALLASSPGGALAQSYDALRGANVATGADGIITGPHHAINVFEFEPAAQKGMFAQAAPAHSGHLQAEVAANGTRERKHAGYPSSHS